MSTTALSRMLTLACALLAFPAFGQSNTNCANAITLDSGVTNTAFTGSLVSSNPTPSCIGCCSGFGRGVWYKFITPAYDVRADISTCGSDFGTTMAVYTGTCDTLAPVQCADRGGPFCGNEAGLSFSASSNTTYFILVGGYGGAGGNLKIVADLATPPANDTCANAIPMAPGIVYSNYTFDATEFGDLTPSCIGCCSGFGRSVWYMITTPTNNVRLDLSTCGSDFGTVLGVYTGTCGSLTQVQCADRGGPLCNNQASLSFSAPSNTIYYIEAGGYGAAWGHLQIEANLVTPPPNDTCAGAIPMISGVTYSNYTFDATEFGDQTPSCIGCCSGFGRSVWYMITTPTNNVRLDLTTCGSDFGTVLGVYTGTCGSLTQVQCADRGGPFCNNQASLSFSAPSNTTYYIEAGGYGAAWGHLQIEANLVTPPANDTCAGAIPMISGVTYSSYTFDATEFGDQTPSCIGCCSGFGRSVWYMITTPTNNVRLDLTTCGSDFGTVLGVYTGACGSLTQVQCADRGGPFCNNQASLSFSAPSNTTYYIEAGGYGAAWGHLQIEANLVTPPPNDTCAGAIPMISGVTYSNYTFDATEFGDLTPSCIGCCSPFGRGVWYMITTPTNNVRLDLTTCGSDFGTVLGVYTGTCGSLTQVQCADRGGPLCNNQASLSFSAPSNTTYYIEVGGYGAAWGHLQIQANLVTPPANDTCANAIPMISGVTYSNYTFDATEFGDQTPSCIGCCSGFGRGVWYSITTPTNNVRLDITTCGSDFGTVLGVYTGTCGSLTQVQCADRGGPFCNNQASLSFSAPSNTIYYILAGGYGAAWGHLQIQANLVTPPANDTCAGAIPMISGVTYSNYTFDATEFGDLTPSCIGCCSGFGRSVWYMITTPTNNVRLDLTTCGSDFGTVLGVYTGTCGSLTQVQCADRGGPFCNNQASLSFSAPSNTTYYIEAGGYGAAWGHLQIQANLATPPANDTCAGAIPMISGVTYSNYTFDATEFGDQTPSCIGCCSGFGRGVWYTVTAPASGLVNISTCGSDFGTVLGIYTGTCGSLTQVQCADRGGPFCNNQASLTFSGVAGTTYYIVAGGYGSAWGHLQIVANVPPPTNSVCSNAVAMTPGTVYTVNTLSAAPTNSPVPTCQAAFGRGVWYSLVAPVTERIDLATCGSDFDTVLAMYTGSCGSLAPAQCADRSSPFCGNRGGFSFIASAGTQYYLLAGGINGAGGNLRIAANVALPPVITNVSPVVGLTNGGTVVNLGGSGFESVSSVSFGSLAAASVIFNSSNSLTAITPASPPGPANITVSNPDGDSFTLSNAFTFQAPPIFVTQPLPQAIPVGSNVQFQVQMSGQPPFTYQWNFNGTNLTDNARVTGSRTNILSVVTLQTNDAGSYQVIVGNSYGSATSIMAALTVLVPPTITTQPLDATNFGGTTATFTVGASGTTPLGYQWRKNGAAIASATGTALTLPNVQLTDAGGYSVLVTNVAGAVTSRVAMLTVSAPSLQIASVAVPTDASTSIPFNVSWIETNAGTATATGPWLDNVYLSATAQFQVAGSQILGSFPYSSNLVAGQSVTRSQSVTIQPGSVTNGQYYIVVLADANGTVPGESGANNPPGISTNFTLHLIPPPDLVVSSLQALGPLISGQALTLTYTALNQGTGAASGNWMDRIYLSTTPNTAGTVASWSAQEYQTLPAGASYSRSKTVTLPALSSGTYYLIAFTDANNTLYESNDSNNTLITNVSVAASASIVISSPSSLKAAMMPGNQTVVSFTVANVGALASGNLQVILPTGAPWLSLVTTQNISSLLPGQSNVVTLALTPPASLPLGPYTGVITLNNSSNLLGVPFEFDCVSALKGAMLVTVKDELSIYGAGSPNVSNATVCLTQLLTGTNTYCATTGPSGILTFTNLPEDYYSVTVQADAHSGFNAVYYVPGSQTLDVSAFLSLDDLVSYSWLVTTSSIPDHYNFQLITTFDSALPPSWPVVTVSADTDSGAINLCDYAGMTNAIISLNISNGGLITAQGLQLNFGSHPDWDIEPMVANIGDLAGMSATNVPVMIHQLSSAAATNETIDAHLYWFVSAPNRDNLYYDSLPPGFVYDADPSQCASGGSIYGPLLAKVAHSGTGGGKGGTSGSGGTGDTNGNSSTSYCLSCASAGASTNNPISLPEVVQIVTDGGKIRAKITLSQNFSTSHDSFTASLQLNNNSGSTLTNFLVTLDLRDATNGPALDRFGLQPANTALGAASVANANSSTVAWNVLPATNAAPVAQTQYALRGSLAYIQSGLQVNIPLPPIPFFVLPVPVLQADYFLERDVYGDDPITLNVVEPSVPFALGLIMRNTGYGDARAVTLLSAQPQIQSTNGMLVPFRLVSSQIGRQAVTPRWDNVGLSDIGPHTNAEALWWMTSPIIGQFDDYKAAFEQVDDLGNTNLSLVDNVAVHPITHVVRATYPLDDGLPDFLTLDTNNIYGLPTTLYNSDGSITNVTSLTNPVVSGAPSPLQTNITLSLVTPATGWAYLRINDPAANGMAIAAVTRADGKSLMMGSNVWTTTTFRTNVASFPGASSYQPAYLHIFDYNPTATYTLTYRIAGPLICPVVPRAIVDGQVLSVTNCINVASSDPPFFWGLDSSAPDGATINLTNGIFNWTPSCAQGSRTYNINLWATNSANPPIASVVTLLVTVSDCLQVSLGSAVVQIGHSPCLPVTLLSSVGLTNLNFIVNAPAGRFATWTITDLNPAIGGTAVTPLDASNTRLTFTAAGQFFQGPMQICSICATALPGPSAFLPVIPTGIVATNSAGLPVGNPAGQGGRVVAIGREPLLEANLGANSARLLTIYGNPNSSYAIGTRTNFSALSTNWLLAWRVPMTNLSQTFPADPAPPILFYRAWEFFADPPILELRPSAPTNFMVLLYGRAGTNYTIEGTTNLNKGSTWVPVTTLGLTNSFQLLNLGNRTNKMFFYRAKR